MSDLHKRDAQFIFKRVSDIILLLLLLLLFCIVKGRNNETSTKRPTDMGHTMKVWENGREGTKQGLGKFGYRNAHFVPIKEMLLSQISGFNTYNTTCQIHPKRV